jgi:hypothetical protein
LRIFTAKSKADQCNTEQIEYFQNKIKSKEDKFKKHIDTYKEQMEQWAVRFKIYQSKGERVRNQFKT